MTKTGVSLLSLVILLLCSCGKSPHANIKEFTVIIDTASFVPETASIQPQTKVTWINKDHLLAHSVVSGKPDKPDHLFESNFLSPSDSFSHLFTKQGTYPYYCSVHPWFMRGVVIVK